jgi:hypothetical protein
MAGFGLRQDDVADLLGIAPKTLRLHYKYELATGMARANAKVAQSLFDNATRHNNVTAQIWWTRARMGWRSETDLNVNSIQTVQMQHLVAARAFSDALHGAPETLPPPIEGKADDDPHAPRDLMQPALE